MALRILLSINQVVTYFTLRWRLSSSEEMEFFCPIR
jgi:hypothetical protein